MIDYGRYFYGDLIKVTAMVVFIPSILYVLHIGWKKKSKPTIAHAFGWLFLAIALAPRDFPFFWKIFPTTEALFTFQTIALALSGVSLALGVSHLVYARNPKKLVNLGWLSILLILQPFYEFLGKAFLPESSFKIFTEVIHVAQYGYLLALLGLIICFSSEEREFRKFGVVYFVMGVIFLVYPFAKAVSTTLRTVDIFLGFLSGIYLANYTLRVVKSRAEIITSEKTTPYIVEGKNVIIADGEKVRLILSELEDFPVLAFVRGFEYPKSWNVRVVTTAPIENGISPTNLEIITELCVHYMEKAKEKGISGVIYIASLEYLKLYNNFITILKFLHRLRDYAIIYDGRVIIEIDEKAWSEKELAQLNLLET
ncbi:DUF835 domain-containing protein [Thermococcus aggregans]|uniref:DUF835 domain-containing protein n=1 Tax=Thermococcus aggregans TaxID=110163 RepID=A0A9E7MZI4_THEAG|nr:DUF835 domain-containing protein [Thermococcus aggregans]USS41617.1 DUF835 domain-containing protein [Thermococcus aggregans]